MNQPDETRRTPTSLYLACGLLMLVIFLADLATPLGVAVNILYIAVVILSLWSSQTNFTVLVAITCSALTIGGFFLSSPAGELWKVIFNRAVALFALWATTVLGRQRIVAEEARTKAAEERQRVLEEIKILRGFLPICASCKKIRDDKGYWTQIETYIGDHSEAEFSHSICPDCARKLYPELYEDELNR
jgi:hypothetical protein